MEWNINAHREHIIYQYLVVWQMQVQTINGMLIPNTYSARTLVWNTFSLTTMHTLEDHIKHIIRYAAIACWQHSSIWQVCSPTLCS